MTVAGQSFLAKKTQRTMISIFCIKTLKNQKMDGNDGESTNIYEKMSRSIQEGSGSPKSPQKIQMQVQIKKNRKANNSNS